MSIIQARISGEEETLIKQYAKTKNISISDLIRNAVMEKIEDEIDLKLYEQTMAEHMKNPQTHSFEEVWKMINEEV